MPDKDKTVDLLMERLGLSKDEARGRVEKIIVEPGRAEAARQVRIKSKHIHRVKLKNIGVNKEYLVYACMDSEDTPGLACNTYFLPSVMVGKQIRCWACKVPFTFATRNLDQVMPRCLNPACIVAKSPQAKAKKARELSGNTPADEILKKLL